jgi:hypothetical protein
MATLPSGLPDLVDDDEDLARFLTSSSEFNRAGVRHPAFVPHEGEKSVFRHGAEPRADLWRIAQTYGVAGNRTLHGAAIVKARRVRDVQLDVEAREPPPRHANIVGWKWSEDDPDVGKAEQKEQALRIAEHAMLVLVETAQDVG